jgi:hypothetical protein
VQTKAPGKVKNMVLFGRNKKLQYLPSSKNKKQHDLKKKRFS